MTARRERTMHRAARCSYVAAMTTTARRGDAAIITRATIVASVMALATALALLCALPAPAHAASASTASSGITSMRLSQTKVTLSKGKTVKLKAIVTPASAKRAGLTWRCANTAIATIGKNGKVKAKAAGVTTVTAKAASGTAASCVIVVTGFVNAKNAYKRLNRFRTGKNAWYWNTGNRTKTRFNTSGHKRLKKLCKNKRLVATARKRAKEMALAGVCSHTRPNGTDCLSIYPTTMSYRGECVAAGFATCKQVITGWKEANASYSGQGHRRCMLSMRFTAVGIAGYVAADGTVYWCMSLGNA